MPTFLESLAAKHRAAERAPLLEHVPWEVADPLTSQTASVAGLGSAANDLFHPTAIGWHSARPGARRHGALPPYYRTQPELWMIGDAARVVEAFCPAAVTVLDTLTQFAIYTGFQYSIVERKLPGDNPGKRRKELQEQELQEPELPEPNPLVDKAQRVIDDWQRLVDWPSWEPELFRRTIRDGEAFLILEEDDDTGLLDLRSIEPEQVREPADQKLVSSKVRSSEPLSWKFGIVTTQEDTSKALAYWVVSQYSDTKNRGELVPADEVFHLKSMWVDRQAKRAVSDFFVGMNDFVGVKKLLRALREGATVQAHIAWIKEHAPGVQPAPVTDGTTTTRTGQTMGSVTYDQPTVVGTPQGTSYTAGPLGMQGKSSALILVLQAALRNIGARWQMPEGMASGDASNANLASALVAEAPFVRAMETRQWWFRSAFKRLFERILQHKLGEDILDKVEVTVEMPKVVPRKELEETQKNAILSDHGILGNTAWSQREDLDREEQLADMERDPIQPPSIMLGMEGEEGEESSDDTSSENSTSADTPGVKQPKSPRTQKASSVTSPSERN